MNNQNFFGTVFFILVPFICAAIIYFIVLSRTVIKEKIDKKSNRYNSNNTKHFFSKNTVLCVPLDALPQVNQGPDPHDKHSSEFQVLNFSSHMELVSKEKGLW